ncbi:FAD:protein FMN transferase [Arenibacter sp. GZD96]|uniref:FAD:protein FMN transferase n=1 Tax=Aurantibrevibacter litoralis TaxID=3106030 RepID=UPI002AFE7AF9|nr:FAD:protein FMN transferase [Arenibacter sp. GZD-96]MEA1786706.1 FAD:protein FMN transferase [Arenibacter sp. GZD-96]
MMDLSKYSVWLYAFFVVGALMVSCTGTLHKPVKNFYTGAAQGTTFHITFFAATELELQEEINQVFQAVDKSMSTYRPDSDISKINTGDTTVVVDHMFREVLELSKEVHKATNGYFDPTVGTLVNAWGFGPGKEVQMDSSKVDSLLSFVGLDKIGITQKNKIKKEHPQMQLDFNAIAQGYTVDQLGLLLDQNNISDYLIEVGGEIRAKGENKQSQKAWTVGIENPKDEGSGSLKHIVALKNAALATSGNYRKFRIDPITGIKYVHTVDPITGFTKNSNVVSVTVIADNCALADAYATAFMAMNLDDSLKLVAAQTALEVYIIYIDQHGEEQEFISDGFKKRMLP